MLSTVMAVTFKTWPSFCLFILVIITQEVLTQKGQNTDFFSNLDGGLFPGSQNNPASTRSIDGSTRSPQDEQSSSTFPVDFPTYSPDSVKSRPVQRAQESGSSINSTSDGASKGQFNLMDINTWDSIPAAFFQPSASSGDRGNTKSTAASKGPAWKNTPLSYSEAGAEPALSWDYSSAGLGSGADLGSGGTQDVFLPLADHSPGSIVADQPVMISDWSVPPVSKDTAKYREEPTSRPSFKRFSDGESMARAILSGTVKKWEWTYSTTLGAGLSSNRGDRNDQSITCCQRLPYICGVDGMCVIGIDECRDFCTCAANPQMPHCIKIIPIIKRTMATLEKKILAKIAKELNMTTTPSSITSQVTRQAPPNYMNPAIAETQYYEELSWGAGRYPTGTTVTQRPVSTRITTATRKPAEILFQPLDSIQQFWSHDVHDGLALQFPSSQKQISSSSKPIPLPVRTPPPTNDQARQEPATLSINKNTFRAPATPAPAATQTSMRPVSMITSSQSSNFNDDSHRFMTSSSTTQTQAPNTEAFKQPGQTTPSKSTTGISKLPFTVDQDAVRPSKRTFLSPTLLTTSPKPTNSTGVYSSNKNNQDSAWLNVYYFTTPATDIDAASKGPSTRSGTVLNKTTREVTSRRPTGSTNTSSNRAKTSRLNTAPVTAGNSNGASTNNSMSKLSRGGPSNKTLSTVGEADKTRKDGVTNKTAGVNTTIPTNFPYWRSVTIKDRNSNNQMDYSSNRRFSTTTSIRTTAEIKMELKSGDILSITELEKHSVDNNNASTDNIRSTTTSDVRMSTYSGNADRLTNTNLNTRLNDSLTTTSKEGLRETTAETTRRSSLNLSHSLKSVTASRTTTTTTTTTTPSTKAPLLSTQSTNTTVSFVSNEASSSITQETTTESGPGTKVITTSTKPTIANIRPQQFATSSTRPVFDLSHSTRSPNSSSEYLPTNFDLTTNSDPHFSNISTDNTTTGTGVNSIEATGTKNEIILNELTSTPWTSTPKAASNISNLNLTTSRIPSMPTTTMIHQLEVEHSTMPLPPADMHFNTKQSNDTHTNTWFQEDDEHYSLRNNVTDESVTKQNISDLARSDQQNKTSLLKGGNKSATSPDDNAHESNKGDHSTPRYSKGLLLCGDGCEDNGGVCVVGDDAWSRCVIVTETCDQIACINGLCVSADGLQLCECLPGWAGSSCDQPCTLDCDERSFCGLGGSINNATCTCRWKYTGKRCEKTLEIIPPNVAVTVPGRGLDTWEVAVVAAVAAVMLGLMCVLSPYILWKNQWLPMRKLIFFFQPYEDNDDKEFDAFISYMSTPRDERFVYRHLYPKLEKELDFRLCLQFQDISPGESISSNIIRAIETSRRTILILSPSYVSSEWTKPEYQKAQSEMLKVKNKIIPIILEDINGMAELDTALKVITDTSNCLKWPGEEKSSTNSEIIKFWKLVELAMPKRRFMSSRSGSQSCVLPVSGSRTSFNSIAYSLTEEDILTSSNLRSGSNKSDSGNSSEKTASFDQLKRSSIGKLRFPEVSWSHLRANSVISLPPPLECRSSTSGSDDTGIDMSARSSIASSDDNIVIKPPLFGCNEGGVVSKGTAFHSNTNLPFNENGEFEMKERLFPGRSDHVVDIRETGHRTRGNIIPALSRNVSAQL